MVAERIEETATAAFVTPQVSAHALRDGLRAALVATSRDAMLPVLCTIRITAEADGSLRFEATDRFRRTEAKVRPHRSANDVTGEGWRVLLGRKDAEQIVKAIPARAGQIDYAELTYEGDGGSDSRQHTTHVTTGKLSVQVNYGAKFTFTGHEGGFPSVDKLWPDMDSAEGAKQIRFSAAHLADIAKLPWPNAKHGATLNIFSSVKPMTVEYDNHGDSREASFRHLIMPQRLSS